MATMLTRRAVARAAAPARRTGKRAAAKRQPSAVKRIFVSHISEEAERAAVLKTMLENDFAGVDVFASSGIDSIVAGQRWLDSIEEALQDAKIGLILCSKSSVQTPWVQFELGVAWMRRIPIIPVCHS